MQGWKQLTDKQTHRCGTDCVAAAMLLPFYLTIYKDINLIAIVKRWGDDKATSAVYYDD